MVHIRAFRDTGVMAYGRGIDGELVAGRVLGDTAAVACEKLAG